MKVLLLITKGEIGGAQIFVANLAKGLKNINKKEIIPTIACGKGDFLFKFAQKERINFQRIKGLQRSSGVLANINFLFNFLRYLRKNSFEVIHLNSTNTLLGALIAKLVNIRTKVVFTVHGLSILDPNYKANHFKKLLFRAFFNFSFSFVDEIVFVSQKNLDLFVKSNKLWANKCHLAYNGVEVDYLKREDARQFIFNKIGLEDEGQFLIGSTGRLAYPKNYEFLIENFPEILKIKPNAKLILMGEGPERSKYEKIIKERGLSGFVFILGEVAEAGKYLKGLDLFVLPSIYEGLSIALIEAYLSGIRSIASLVGGNDEIVGEDNCFKLNDLNDFLAVFKLILDEQKSCTDKNQYNLNRNKFLVEVMVNKYLDIYEG
ncbi:MAG TPA: glycosyltransferase [bacterium]|nr:glycosyltransferase [bacterium]